MQQPLLNFIILFLSLFGCSYSEKYDLCIVTIFRDDAKYLPEWIDFHLAQGVDHIYLYNNLSADNYAEILQPYILKKQVTLTNWPYDYTNGNDWNTIQCNAYTHGIQHSKSKWVACLDTDEFLFSPEDDLKRILTYYKQYGGVAVNWVMYGTSNVAKIPVGKKMIECLLMRAPIDFIGNRSVKTIVQVKYFDNCVNPHWMIYKNGKYAVNENFIHVPYHDSDISVSRFRINHYWSRDMDFFYNVKLPRRAKWYNDSQSEIDREKLMNAEFDDCIMKLSWPICDHMQKVY